MKKRLSLFVAIFFAINAICAAQQFDDTSFRQRAINNLVQFYNESIGLQAHLYNGPLYTYFPRAFTDGHPFFESDSSTVGSVAYDGLEYDHVLMNYDLVRDELIIFHPQGNYPVNLIKTKVDNFSLRNHRFVKLVNNRTNNFPATGFYDKLFSSPAISFFVKRRKTIQEMSARATIETRIYLETTYYILKDGVFYTVKNKNSLFDILKEKRNSIQQFAKNNNLRYKNNIEEEILSTVKYYDQIMKTP